MTTTRLTFDINNNDLIVWQGQIVMSSSEEPYFAKMFCSIAQILRPKRVLEIGFGLGISARLIQNHLEPSSHHIVEIDSSIHANLERFSLDYPCITPFAGDWRCITLEEPYDFIFYDPFDYFGEGGIRDNEEGHLLKNLLDDSGVLCHPHFGDGRPRHIPGFRNRVLERYQVPPIAMADGSFCEQCAAVLCYPIKA